MILCGSSEMCLSHIGLDNLYTQTQTHMQHTHYSSRPTKLSHRCIAKQHEYKKSHVFDATFRWHCHCSSDIIVVHLQIQYSVWVSVNAFLRHFKPWCVRAVRLHSFGAFVCVEEVICMRATNFGFQLSIEHFSCMCMCISMHTQFIQLLHMGTIASWNCTRSM